MKKLSFEDALEESRDPSFRSEVDKIVESMPDDFKLSLKFRLKMWLMFRKYQILTLLK